MNSEVEQRLGKIVALAKKGVGGEKESALRIVRRLCALHHLDFDEVMRAEEKAEQRFVYYKHAYEEIVASQVVFRFGITKEHPEVRINKRARVVIFDATTEKYVECLAAVEAYLTVFRRERATLLKDMPIAFISRHGLFSRVADDEDDEPPKPKTLKQRQAAWRRAQLSQSMMEHVDVQKRIGKEEA